MAKFFYVVMTKARDGEIAEFDRWYDEQHIPDCLNVPGVISAKRYRSLYSVDKGERIPGTPFDSLAIYEFEAEDALTVARALRSLAGTEAMPLSDTLLLEDAVKVVAVAADE